MNPEGLLKMSELADRSGVSAGTIKHYLREGLLGEGEDIVRTSRNMAYYPPEYVDRLRLIKRLQEDRFMPLRVIREVMAADPGRAAALVELEDRILDRALAAGPAERISAAEVRRRYDVPQNVLRRLGELGVLSPNSRGYDPDDVRIVAAISRFRAGGKRGGSGRRRWLGGREEDREQHEQQRQACHLGEREHREHAEPAAGHPGEEVRSTPREACAEGQSESSHDGGA